jgi:sugar phosphate isomerase/epimerase
LTINQDREIIAFLTGVGAEALRRIRHPCRCVHEEAVVEVGMCMASLLDRGWEAALDATLELGVRSVEATGGGHVPYRHLDPKELAGNPAARRDFVAPVEARGMTIAALGCYGNFLDPDPSARAMALEDLRAAMRAASELGIRVVTSNAGCPGGAPGDTTPNWIVHSLFPKRWDDSYRWQWEAEVIPIWQELGALAETYDVLLCLEPMAGDVVYNLATFRRLREHAGERIMCHVDPSHLWWQGIDIAEFIASLDGAVGFAHAKDVTFEQRNLRLEGLLPSCSYDDWDSRSWSMRAVGHGHSEVFWREYLIALRRAGYDGCVAIEFQEPYMTVPDGLRRSVDLIAAAMPLDPPPAGNWAEMYEP